MFGRRWRPSRNGLWNLLSKKGPSEIKRLPIHSPLDLCTAYAYIYIYMYIYIYIYIYIYEYELYKLELKRKFSFLYFRKKVFSLFAKICSERWYNYEIIPEIFTKFARKYKKRIFYLEGSRLRISTTWHLGQGIKDKTDRARQWEHESKGKTAGTNRAGTRMLVAGKLEQESLERTARTGQPWQDREDRMAWTWQQGPDS